MMQSKMLINAVADYIVEGINFTVFQLFVSVSLCRKIASVVVHIEVITSLESKAS